VLQIFMAAENSAKPGIKLQFERNDLLHLQISKNVVDISSVRGGLERRNLFVKEEVMGVP
jgi:hypothetical protein